MYKAALKEMIEKIPDLMDQGKPVVVTEEMTDETFKNLILKIIPVLDKTDYFTTNTKSVLKGFGWTRENGWDKSALEIKSVIVLPRDETHIETDINDVPIAPDELLEETIGPEPEEEYSLKDAIESEDRIKELKNICQSEPAFKSIRGKLASYKQIEYLKNEMLDLLKAPIEDVPEKLHKVIEAEPIRIPKHIDKEVELFKSGMMATDLIQTRPPFSSLFEIRMPVLHAVTKSMQKNGYDPAYPCVLWGNVLLDGHTRLKAAIAAELKEIPVEVKEFKNKKEALAYAIHNQRDRRNLNDVELLRCIREVDAPMSKIEAGARKGEDEKIVPSHKVTARVLGIGESVVSDARTVLADPEASKSVESGKKSIRAAAKKVREAKRKPKEVIVEPKTPVEIVVKVLRDNAGNSLEIASIIEQSAELLKVELQEAEEVINIVLEVLIAARFVKVQSGDKVLIKKTLK